MEGAGLRLRRWKTEEEKAKKRSTRPELEPSSKGKQEANDENSSPPVFKQGEQSSADDVVIETTVCSENPIADYIRRSNVLRTPFSPPVKGAKCMFQWRQVLPIRPGGVYITLERIFEIFLEQSLLLQKDCLE